MFGNGIFQDNVFPLNVSRGRIEGYGSVFKFGRVSGVTTSEQVIWDGGGSYVFLDTAETLEVVSDNAIDNVSGSGARTVIVYGLDENGLEISELVSLNGTTPVTTTNLFLRTFRALVLTAGTNTPISGSNFGTITFTTSGTAQLQAQINPNEGQTLMCVYTVPSNKTGFVTGIGANVPAGKSVTVRFKFRNTLKSSNGAFSVKYTLDMFEQAISQSLEIPLELPSLTDVVVTAVNGASATDVGASFGLYLIENTKI